MIDDRMPVLVGGGQVVQKEKDVHKAKSPADLMADAARLAIADSGAADKVIPAIDTVTVVRLIVDTAGPSRVPFSAYGNLPLSLANRLGATPRNTIYGPTGGNTPQYLVNYTAERIAAGEQEVALLAGVECFATMARARAQNEALDWAEDAGGNRIELAPVKPGASEVERKHALDFPVNAYPLFENAIRGQEGQTVEQHQLAIGRLMAPFTQVAAQHPQAWFPTVRTPEEIATPADTNRYVGFPYTKYMNAVMQVDQAAAVVMMSVAKARELGVPQDRWVYLHGCADANDIWNLTERVNYYSSPAIRAMGRKALDMAGWSMADIDYIDLYSCFPSAVQIGRDELGIPEDDPRPLTVTGGLPYFGGAGNDYVMHSIVTMMTKLRARPGSKGLCTANGYYVTKHSIGLYSTAPVEGAWAREDPAGYQREIDNEAHPAAEERPDGPAKIETYTVMHGREGPQFGIVMGRLDENDKRFVSQVRVPEQARSLMEVESLGRPGTVENRADGMNIFTPD